MTPILSCIDHIHVYVDDRGEAEEWYRYVLGLTRVDALMIWAVDNGPLTVENTNGNIHLALFEQKGPANTSAIAFGASGEEFMAWKTHLESHGLVLRIADHKVAYSLYLSDPWGNNHEITTYEHDYVAKQLG